jgi:DNA-binding response OmpR family regulator
MQKDKKISSKESARASTVARKIAPRRILVVDDDPDTRQLSVDVLVSANFEVDAAVDGADGWEALQAKHFDLVITDNTMPRMTGVELIEKLRFSGITIPVIMATAHMPTLDFIRKPWLRPDVGLITPVSDDELMAAISSVLHQDDDKDDDIHPESLLPKYL